MSDRRARFLLRGAAAFLLAFPACGNAQSQPGGTPPPSRTTWRDAVEQLEGHLDRAFGELTWTEQTTEPLVGIFVPSDDSPEAARALPEQWTPLAEAPAVPTRVVLLVHGLDEPGDIWCDLAEALARDGHAVARFEYPNDQRVHDSGAAMVEHLRAARAAGVEEVTIVAHSMGGLVSFDALTREDGYAGAVRPAGSLPRVTRFVAVGTPWEGSAWAPLRAAAEIREQITRWVRDESWDIRPMLNYRRDGVGQAGQDLAPGSALILELATRPWPEGLPLTVLAGQITRPDPGTLDTLGDSKLLRELLGPGPLDRITADLRRASEELGDGVVSLQSALARETEDAWVFEVNHRALVRRSPVDFLTGQEPGGPPGIAIILDRLKADLDGGAAEEPDGE
jgi:pimeloyl-ACP methyl ester carboxylesterase